MSGFPGETKIHHGIADITTAQLHSTKLEFRFCSRSNSAPGVLETYDGENLRDCPRLEVPSRHLPAQS